MNGWQVAVILILAIPAAPFVMVGAVCSTIHGKWHESYPRDKLKTTTLRVHRDPQSFTYRAMAYFARHDPTEKVLRVLDKALDKDPNYPPALYLKANLLVSTGQYDAALPLLLRVVELCRQPADADAAQSSSSSASSSDSDLRDLSFPMKESDSGVFEIRAFELINNLGKCQFELGQVEEALASFQLSARQYSSWLATYNIGECQVRLGRLDEARNTLSAALHQFKEEQPSWAQYGTVVPLLELRVRLWQQLGDETLLNQDNQLLAVACTHAPEDTIDWSEFYP